MRFRIAACAFLLCAALEARADDFTLDDAPVALPAPAEKLQPAEPATPQTEPAPMESLAPARSAPLPPHVPSNGRAAIDAWDHERGIRYGTQMLFPFTRGMPDAGIRGWARYPMALFTLPIDVALLPTGILAGLFGG